MKKKSWHVSPSLLPCPFCGASEQKRKGGRVYGVQVRCDYCGARGPTAGNTFDARVYWNERAGKRVATKPTGVRFDSVRTGTGL